MINFTEEILFVLENTWPVMVITLVSIISLRISYLIKERPKFSLFEELLALIFIIYILMFFEVVTYQDVISYGNNFIPFRELTRYQFGSRLFFKNVIGNILLFMPYGFFASYYLKLDKKRYAFALILLVSLTIEGVQLLIGRCFDVDDILLNLVGGMFGYYIYRLFDLVNKKLSKRAITTLLIIGIMVGVLALLVIMI